jgi:hypothetical protein
MKVTSPAVSTYEVEATCRSQLTLYPEVGRLKDRYWKSCISFVKAKKGVASKFVLFTVLKNLLSGQTKTTFSKTNIILGKDMTQTRC